VTVYVTLKCDGTMPPGGKDPCRGGKSERARVWDAECGEHVELSAAWKAAEGAGWTEAHELEDGEYVCRHYCAACTRARQQAPA